jgi:hypothetical protein
MKTKKEKPELCGFCLEPIKTEKSKVTTYDGEEGEWVETGYAHRGCAIRNGGEEIIPPRKSK